MHVWPMIIILFYNYIICGCSVWVRVCVHLRTHVYANVYVCGRMNVRVMCAYASARVYVCA